MGKTRFGEIRDDGRRRVAEQDGKPQTVAATVLAIPSGGIGGSTGVPMAVQRGTTRVKPYSWRVALQGRPLVAPNPLSSLR